MLGAAGLSQKYEEKIQNMFEHNSRKNILLKLDNHIRNLKQADVHKDVSRDGYFLEIL
jgi:hypothetical protein